MHEHITLTDESALLIILLAFEVYFKKYNKFFGFDYNLRSDTEAFFVRTRVSLPSQRHPVFTLNSCHLALLPAKTLTSLHYHSALHICSFFNDKYSTLFHLHIISRKEGFSQGFPVKES